MQCTVLGMAKIDISTTPSCGDRSGRKYSEKYVFMSKNMTFGLHVLTLLKGPQIHLFFKPKISFIYCHIEPTCQKIGIYGDNCDFWLVRVPFALFNGNFQK